MAEENNVNNTQEETPTHELSIKAVTNDDQLIMCRFGNQLYEDEYKNYPVVINAMTSALEALKTKEMFEVESCGVLIEPNVECKNIRYITALYDCDDPLASIRDIDFSDLDKLEYNSTIEVYVRKEPPEIPEIFPKITDPAILEKIGKTRIGIDGKRAGVEVDFDKDLYYKFIMESGLVADKGDIRAQTKENFKHRNPCFMVEPGIDQDRFTTFYCPSSNIAKVEVYDSDRNLIMTVTPEQMPFYKEKQTLYNQSDDKNR